MSKRLTVLLFALAALVLAPRAVLQAHEGHDHKVMGTVTMAGADHVMLKTTDGKDVTVMVTKDTKVVRGKTAMKMSDVKTGSRIVITAAEEKGRMNAKTIELAAETPAQSTTAATKKQ